MKIRNLIKLLLLFALVLGCSQQSNESNSSNRATEPVQQPTTTDSGDSDTTSPESVLRTFLIGMAEKNQEVLIRTGNGEGPMELLLDGDPLTPEQLAAFKKDFETMEITRLKVGDSMTFPGGKRIVFKEHDINPDRLKLMVPANPIAYDLQRFDGIWYVNVDTIIEVRKAAKQLK